MPTSSNDDRTRDFVLIGLGANLPSAYGSPKETCALALDTLADIGVAAVLEALALVPKRSGAVV